jgi:para-aminobenzoate synthetase/4-amino-4-deoxychorismate lyase
VILWNPLREVTEATTANVVAELDGVRVTPPVTCGLLGGTFRAELLARREIQERVLTLDDLQSASRLWLINSVHEWREAILST